MNSLGTSWHLQWGWIFVVIFVRTSWFPLEIKSVVFGIFWVLVKRIAHSNIMFFPWSVYMCIHTYRHIYISTCLHIISINNKNTPVAGLAACSSFHSDGLRLQMETAECQVQRLDVGATAWGRSQDVLRERYVNSHEGDGWRYRQNDNGMENVDCLSTDIHVEFSMTAIRRSFLSWLKLGFVICHDETHKLNWLMWFAGPDVSRNDSGKSTTQRGGFQQSDAEESSCCHILDLDLWRTKCPWTLHGTPWLHGCLGVPSEAHCQIWRGRHLRSHWSSVRGLNLFPGWASGCVKWFFPGFSKEWDIMRPLMTVKLGLNDFCFPCFFLGIIVIHDPWRGWSGRLKIFKAPR